MLEDGHHELYGQSGSDQRYPRTCYSTLLIQCPILGRLKRLIIILKYDVHLNSSLN